MRAPLGLVVAGMSDDIGKFGIAAMRRLPMRHSERGSIISLLIERNAGCDVEQIRETANTGRLHARVEHHPNFLVALAGIVCPFWSKLCPLRQL
jgi:hypothetical protein